MAKPIAIYYPAKLLECPEKWWHYKELIYNTPLVIMESEDKYPGEIFFNFASLSSSVIVKFETIQETLDSDIYVDIITKHSHYKFIVGGDYAWY